MVRRPLRLAAYHTDRNNWDSLDRRDLDWFVDKFMQLLMFVAGLSAIFFIIGIFVFIAREGMGFRVIPP